MSYQVLIRLLKTLKYMGFELDEYLLESFSSTLKKTKKISAEILSQNSYI